MYEYIFLVLPVKKDKKRNQQTNDCFPVAYRYRFIITLYFLPDNLFSAIWYQEQLNAFCLIVLFDIFSYFSKRYVPPAMIVIPPMIPMINGAITVIPSVFVYVGFF